LTRLEQLLSMVEEAALADKHAGRLVWGDNQLELVRLVRAMLKPKPRGFQKNNKHAGKGFNAPVRSSK
jgi:hypothetical protein